MPERTVEPMCLSTAAKAGADQRRLLGATVVYSIVIDPQSNCLRRYTLWDLQAGEQIMADSSRSRKKTYNDAKSALKARSTNAPGLVDQHPGSG